MSRTQRQAVIVLGMHRSGTSALAGVLGLMGARLPARLMPAGPGNPKGYFEPGHIVVIHDRILAAAGTSWAGWEPISEAWLRSDASRPFVDELAAAVLEDYGESGLFMVKDPRMCRLMPLWFRVLEQIDAQASFLLPFRNPVEVARSVERREGLPLPYGCVAWLRYVLEAEQQTRGHPRAFLSYGDLVADPRAAIEHAVAALPLDWPGPLDKVAGEIREFIDPGLRHQIAGEAAIDDMGEYSPWLRQALGHYQALARAGDEGVPAALDALREQFDAAVALFTPALKRHADLPAAEQQHVRAEREREADRLRTELVVLQRSLAGARDRAARLAAELDTRAAELAATMEQVVRGEAQLEEARQRGAELEQRLAARSQEVEALGADLAAAVHRAEVRAASLQAVVAALHGSTSWRVTAPLRWIKRLVGRFRLNTIAFPIALAWQAFRTRSRAPLRVFRDARVIAGSGLFDRGWYLRSNPDVDDARLDPVRHYVAFGAWEGRDPNPSFGTRTYLARNPDVAATRMNPLAHFVRFGAPEGRLMAPSETLPLADAADLPVPAAPEIVEVLSPSPAPSLAPSLSPSPAPSLCPSEARRAPEPDPAWHYPSREALEADRRLLRDSGLLDPAFYRTASGIDAQTDPEQHYLREGWRAGYEPGPHFQGTALYPYYRSAGHSGPPAITYLKLSRAGRPAFATVADAERWASTIRPNSLFNAKGYAARFPDLAGLDPALHYVIVGEGSGVPPSDSFDPVYYRGRNPDVVAAGASLLGHYVMSGRSEGRRPTSSAAQFRFDRSRLRAGRKVVVVISHDASRTGAPILAWNIAAQLSDRYDVVAVLLGGGELSDSFARTCAAVVGPLPRELWHPLEAEYIVDRLVDTYSIAYAIANSTESRLFVPALTTAMIPAVSLIHEFATYTRPKGALGEGALWSTEVVFSSTLTSESALRETPSLTNRKLHILPQGRCELPGAPKSSRAELARLRQVFRPAGFENAMVVLGAGFVHIRKGVDLFLACAAAVAAARPKRPVRFIWIGNGYDVVNDPYYSSYLGEQIERSGLADTVAVIDAIADIESAYAMTDVFFLSSRLDPLPNVTIDSAYHGTPVVCFAGASGMAALLAEQPALRRCVVPHLDVHAAANVIVELANDEQELERLGAEMRRFAETRFDMATYVGRIDELGRAGVDAMRRRAEDLATIRDDPLFDESMFCPPAAPAASRAEAIRQFLAHWTAVRTSRKPALDFFFRRPCPGFHPQIYAHENAARLDAAVENPLAHFIRAGKPEGPWRHEVITAAADQAPRPARGTVALHGHFYYPELAGDLLHKLAANRSQIDLLLSTDTRAKARQLRKATGRYSGGEVTIRTVPNRGRDIGPFLAGFNDVISNYAVVGHVHAKRSAFAQGSADPGMGDRRREFLWQSLIGGASPMADTVLERFDGDPELGIVFAEDPTLSDWDDNLELASELAKRMRLKESLPPFFEFPGGNMFWVRPRALAPLFALELGWADFPAEPVPEDGTILHAIERLLPFVARHAGYRFVTARVPGVTW